MPKYPNVVCLLVGRDFKAGDPKPDGYLERIDWAKAQMKAGLQQRRCPHGRYLFPQEPDDCLLRTERPS